MAAKGLGYGEVARAIGLEDKQAVWALVERDSKKSKFAGKLATLFGVPLERLMADDFELGEGSAVHQVGAQYKADHADSDTMLALLRTFLQLDAEGRHQLLLAAEAVVRERGGGSGTKQARRSKRR